MKTDKKKCPVCGGKVKYFNVMFGGEGEKCSNNKKHYSYYYADIQLVKI